MEKDTMQVKGVETPIKDVQKKWHITAFQKVREAFLHFVGWPTEKDVIEEELINNEGKGPKS